MNDTRRPNARDVLSARERQIAEEFAGGKDYRTIAEELCIAPATVRTHLQRVYRKLEVSNKVSLGRALGDENQPQEEQVAGYGSDGDDIGLKDQSDIRYVASRDGTSIGHAAVGDGYPVVVAGSWLTHLTLSWEPLHLEGRRLARLARHFRLIRYDQRGSGMSEWNAQIEFDRMVEDLESVVESYPYEKVAIYARSQGAAVSMAYALRRPEKVSHLILQGAYARGRRRRGDKAAEAQSHAMVTLIREGWGASNPAFRQVMTTLFAEASTPDEIAYFNEFQKQSGPAENIARYREMFDEIDVSELAPQLSVPTLILHSDGDAIAPLSEAKYLAASVPGARLVVFNSANHLLRAEDRAFPELIQSMCDFVYSPTENAS